MSAGENVSVDEDNVRNRVDATAGDNLACIYGLGVNGDNGGSEQGDRAEDLHEGSVSSA